jgi:hypothetical protein
VGIPRGQAQHAIACALEVLVAERIEPFAPLVHLTIDLHDEPHHVDTRRLVEQGRLEVHRVVKLVIRWGARERPRLALRTRNQPSASEPSTQPAMQLARLAGLQIRESPPMPDIWSSYGVSSAKRS